MASSSTSACVASFPHRSSTSVGSWGAEGCGSAAAVLDGGGTRSGYVLHLDGAEHWVVQGLTVRHGQKGVMVDASRDVVLRGLTVHTIGDEAVHLRRGTTDSLVERNLISDTGLREPRFGEGVYVGSAHSNWCDLTDCDPDLSDRNVVRENGGNGVRCFTCLMVNNLVTSNGGFGVEVGSQASWSGNVFYGNSLGNTTGTSVLQLAPNRCGNVLCP